MEGGQTPFAGKTGLRCGRLTDGEQYATMRHQHSNGHQHDRDGFWRYLLPAVLALVISNTALAQAQRGDLVRIMVSPSKPGMNYEVGEEVTFDIAVYMYGQRVRDARVQYAVGAEKMDPAAQGDLVLPEGMGVLQSSMSAPGFLTCRVSYEHNGVTYVNHGTAGIAPAQIRPTTTLPPDFLDFWQRQKEALREIAVEPELMHMPDRSTAHADVYHVRFRNVTGYIYGILSVPKAEGRFPALLHVPGAGIRPYAGDISQEAVITLQIGIHGIPVQAPSSLYTDLMAGPLEGYWRTNLDNKETYYFRRVYLGCVRAVDFLHTLSKFDGENLGVSGGSQGGALAIVTAALDDRVDYLVSYYAALCDLTGYLHGRAGGWPHLFRDDFTNQVAKIETSRYYDVVNFAQQVKVPGYYAMGYNDNVCPPTSIFSALNVLGAPAQVSLYLDSAHWQYPEQSEEGRDWILRKLGVRR